MEALKEIIELKDIINNCDISNCGSCSYLKDEAQIIADDHKFKGGCGGEFEKEREIFFICGCNCNNVLCPTCQKEKETCDKIQQINNEIQDGNN